MAKDTKPDCSCMVINYLSLKPEASHLPEKLGLLRPLAHTTIQGQTVSVCTLKPYVLALVLSKSHLGPEAQVAVVRQSQNDLMSRPAGLFVSLAVQS